MRKTCYLDEDLEKGTDLETENLDMISERPPWFALPRNGGGDRDLADYPLDYQPRQKTLNYSELP